MTTKFTLKATIPVVQYGNIMPEIEVEAEDFKTASKMAFKHLQKIWNTYGEKPLNKKAKPVKVGKGSFETLTTFTGEKLKYNAATHEYTDMAGNHLVSGSEYKKSFDKEFPLDLMAAKVGNKYGVPAEVVAAMWKSNSYVSTSFGTSIHAAMEHWFRYKDSACGEKEYNLPKHPFLRGAITTFPLKDAQVLPELLVSHVASFMAGRIDGITIIGDKTAIVIDYKSDADIQKNLEGHFKQLSYYAEILRKAGWSIPKVQVWNYTDKWEMYESDVIEITNIIGSSSK